jgi:hypothetical protein
VGRVRLAGAALGLVAALSAGCATSAQGTSPAAVDSAPAGPSPPPSPAASGVPLGKAAQADNGQVQATVFAYRQPAAPGGPGGTEWGGADVQVCVAPTAIFDVSVSRGPWQVLTADGRTVPATLTIDPGFPQPPYPTDHRRMRQGDCVRGWIGFAVPADARAVAVRYAPTGAQPVSWTLR